MLQISKLKYFSLIVVLSFFIIFLVLGLFIYKDYGISTDEDRNFIRGEETLNYITKGDWTIPEWPDKYHGTVFVTTLSVLDNIFKIDDDIQSKYYFRHLLNFLLFYISAFFFYLLIKKIFKNWKIGLLASLFLIISPRIFADSFYNPKDLPFLSFFIICIYTLYNYLHNKTIINAIIHGFTCSYLIGIRILGIIIPFLTIIFFIIDIFLKKDEFIKNRFIKITSIVLFIITTFALTVLFLPIFWENPVYNFIQSFKQSAWFPWYKDNLFLGNFIQADSLPWYYSIVWITITTPFLYLILFILGFILIIYGFLHKPLIYYKENYIFLIILAGFLIPLLAVIVFKSTLYNGWRQLFFIYPLLLIISIYGLKNTYLFFINLYKNSKRKIPLKILNIFLILVFISGIISPAYFMIRYHPHQNIYFNFIAGNDYKKNFDLDYWNLSYKQLLEYILKNDKRREIKVNISNYAGGFILNILPANERERINYVSDINIADYNISDYRYHPDEYQPEEVSYGNEYYFIKINDTKIAVIYKYFGNYLMRKSFFQILNRQSTEQEINYFIKKMKDNEINLTDFFLSLFTSKEFKDRNLSNEDYIKLVYLVLLNREPDTDGYNHWLNLLNSGDSRDFILNSILQSNEYKNFLNGFHL